MIIRFCPDCGNKLIEGAAFCPSCGSRIQSPQEPAASSVIQQVDEQEKAQDILKRFGIKNGVYREPEQPPLNNESTSNTFQDPDPVDLPPIPTQVPPEPTPIPHIDEPTQEEYFEQEESTEEPPLINEEPSPEKSWDEQVEERQQKLNEARKSKAKDPTSREKRESRTSNNSRSFAGIFSSTESMDEATIDSKGRIIIEDNLYNKSVQNDHNAEVKEITDKVNRDEKAAQMRSRSANTVSNIKGRAHKASSIIVNKAVDVAGRHLITEDKALESRRKVYIIEQEEMADPDDPFYDGYYENILPIDANSDDKGKTDGSSKFTLNEESKKTILILIALIIALVVVILTQF